MTSAANGFRVNFYQHFGNAATKSELHSGRPRSAFVRWMHTLVDNVISKCRRLSTSERGSRRHPWSIPEHPAHTEAHRHPISLIAVSPSHPPIDRVWVECKTFPTLVRRCTHAEKDYFTLLLLLFVPSWVFCFCLLFCFGRGGVYRKYACLRLDHHNNKPII